MEVCSKRHITGFLSSSVTFNESDNDKNIDFSKQAGHNIVLISRRLCRRRFAMNLF